MEWHDPGVIIPAGIGWTGMMLGIIRSFIKRGADKHDEKHAEEATKITNLEKDNRRVERELLELKANLPIDYYRREDMIRFETIMHAKLDALALNIQQLECRKCPKP